MSTITERPGSFDWTGVVDFSARYVNEAPQAQHEIPGVTEEIHQVPCVAGDTHEGMPMAVVPLWHAAVTARLNVPTGDKEGVPGGAELS